MNVLFGEIERGLNVGEEIEQIVASSLQGASHAPCKLFERLFQLVARAGLDDGVDGFGASQIEFAGQKSSECELARLGSAAAGLEKLSNQQLHQRRAREHVNLGEILSGVAVRCGPEIHVRWERSQIRQPQMSR